MQAKFFKVLEQNEMYIGADQKDRELMLDGFLSASSTLRKLQIKDPFWVKGFQLYEEIKAKYKHLTQKDICKMFNVSSTTFLVFRRKYKITHDFSHNRKAIYLLTEENEKLFNKMSEMKNIHTSNSIKEKYEVSNYKKNPCFTKNSQPRKGQWPLDAAKRWREKNPIL